MEEIQTLPLVLVHLVKVMEAVQDILVDQLHIQQVVEVELVQWELQEVLLP